MRCLLEGWKPYSSVEVAEEAEFLKVLLQLAEKLVKPFPSALPQSQHLFGRNSVGVLNPDHSAHTRLSSPFLENVNSTACFTFSHMCLALGIKPNGHVRRDSLATRTVSLRFSHGPTPSCTRPFFRTRLHGIFTGLKRRIIILAAYFSVNLNLLAKVSSIGLKSPPVILFTIFA